MAAYEAMTFADISVWTENWLEQTGQRRPMSLNGSSRHPEEVKRG